jgi:hypothetical protein
MTFSARHGVVILSTDFNWRKNLLEKTFDRQNRTSFDELKRSNQKLNMRTRYYSVFYMNLKKCRTITILIRGCGCRCDRWIRYSHTHIQLQIDPHSPKKWFYLRKERTIFEFELYSISKQYTVADHKQLRLAILSSRNMVKKTQYETYIAPPLWNEFFFLPFRLVCLLTTKKSESIYIS